MAEIIDASSEQERFNLNLALKKHFDNKQVPVISDGYCIDCDNAIPQPRLKANPHAERCIDCQKVHEFKQSRGLC